MSLREGYRDNPVVNLNHLDECEPCTINLDIQKCHVRKVRQLKRQLSVCNTSCLIWLAVSVFVIAAMAIEQMIMH